MCSCTDVAYFVILFTMYHHIFEAIIAFVEEKRVIMFHGGNERIRERKDTRIPEKYVRRLTNNPSKENGRIMCTERENFGLDRVPIENYFLSRPL